MVDNVNALQVGAPDPSLQNSPIIEETDYDYDVMGQELPGTAACYFNGNPYHDGQYICSGHELLVCNRGAWLRTGSCDPDNP